MQLPEEIIDINEVGKNPHCAIAINVRTVDRMLDHFPFNVALGIPLYYAVIVTLWS